MNKHSLNLIKIIDSSDRKAFEAFADPAQMSRWFTTKMEIDLREGGSYSNADGDRGEYLKIEPPSRLAFTWDNEKHCPGTVVEITFTARGPGRVEISLEHSELASAEDVKDMNTGWSWALDSLKSYLETGRPVPFEEWKAANG